MTKVQQPTSFETLSLDFKFEQLTLFNTLSARAEQFPGYEFLTNLDTGRSFTYTELVEQSGRYSAWMAAHGIGKGSHVAVQLPNSTEHILIYVALSRLGAVAIPLNTQATGKLLEHYLDNSDSTFFICEAGNQDVFDIAHNLGIQTLGFTGEWSTLNRDGYTHEDMQAYGSDEVPAVDVDPTDLGYINYTSGTTGPSKGVMMSHIRATLWGFSHTVSFGYNDSDRVFICLPLFHVNAFQGALNCAIGANCRIFLRGKFSASGFWDDIRSNQVTATNLLGSMAAILWKKPHHPEDSENDLRMVMTVPIPPYAKEFEDRFELRFTSGYSLTDYGPSHAYTLGDPPEKLGSAGKLRIGMNARIVDANDMDVGVNEKGQLLIRTDIPWNESSGYYGMPEKTLESRRNSWFHTGDMCRIDEDGYMWFEDRMKDVIRRRGENISAFELEKMVLNFPEAKDVAAIAVPSDLEEDEIALFVETSDISVETSKALFNYCTRELPRYMQPEYCIPVLRFPRNASHKVLKYELKGAFSPDVFNEFRRQSD